MSILQKFNDIISTLTGRKKVKEYIKKMSDYPLCLGCEKETYRIIEDKWCFQCYYEKTSTNH